MFAYPRYIFYHALSFFAALSGPPLSLQVPESVRGTLKVDTGSPLGEVERGRAREGEGGYQISGRPSIRGIPFGIILATMLTFKNSVEKTVPKREPMGTQMDANRISKSIKNTKK